MHLRWYPPGAAGLIISGDCKRPHFIQLTVIALHRFSIVIAGLLFFSAGSKAQPKDSLYNKLIFAGPGSDVLQSSVNDLALYLEKATGSVFKKENLSADKRSGIYITLLRPALLPADLEQRLKKGSIEDFIITPSGSRLLIVANHELGLSRAIYTYLDQLGFRWYLPGDEWSFIPRLTSIQINKVLAVSPAFEFRNFAGTGGILPIKEIDPKGELEERWQSWRRRNRSGGEYTLSGHYGETFNTVHQKILEQNPQWLALVNGKRNWSVTAKWCISNAGFRAFFIADRAKELRQKLAAQPTASEKTVLTVDPADGGNHCECDNCRKLGSVSNRIYLLANETATALAKISPRAFVNLYAYNEHAAPPAFNIAPNVLVVIVPYAFQQIAKPQQFIALWKQRHNNLLVYDYYGIPDWHQDQPLTGTTWGLDAWVKRVKSWQAAGLKGFLYETSYSTMCTGLGLYLSGRLGWNKTENTEKELGGFYQQMFGGAALYITPFFQKLQNNFRGAADLPSLFQWVAQAVQGTTDPLVRKRLTVLQSYLNYLALFYKHKAASGDENLRRQLFRYVYGIYPQASIHSTRIGELLYFPLEEGSAERKYWQPYAPVGNGLKNIKFFTDAEIHQQFLEFAKAYPVLEGFDVKAGSRQLKYVIATATPQKAPEGEGLLIADFPQTLVQTSAAGQVRFWLKVNEASENNKTQRFKVALTDTADGTVIAQTEVSIDHNWKIIALTAQPGKFYRLGMTPQNWIRFAAPRQQWLAFQNIPTYAVLGRLWFFVPEGMPYLYFSNKGSTQPVFRDKNGKQILAQKVNEVNLYRIPTGKSQKQWWTVEGSEYQTLEFYSGLLFFTHPNMQAN
jgi:hypothetical protein